MVDITQKLTGQQCDIILNEKLGVIVDKRLQIKVSLLKDVLKVNSDRKENRMVKAAQTHRSVLILQNIYRSLIAKLDNELKIPF